MLRDFKKLKVNSVYELGKWDPVLLYEKVCKLTGVRQDSCVLDTFSAAVAQAKNPHLPKEQRQWWHWKSYPKKRSGQRAALTPFRGLLIIHREGF